MSKPRKTKTTFDNTQIKSFGMSNDPGTGMLFGQTFSNSGVPVTSTTALTVPAVLCAVRAISEDIAKMDFGVTKPTPNRMGHLPFYQHPLNEVLDAPNAWMTAYDFKAFLAASYALKGNAYSVIVRENGYTPSELIGINPDLVQPHLHIDGRISYCVHHPLLAEGGAIWVRAEDMLHVRGFSLNGFVGVSPVQMMAESIGLAIATQQNAAKLFGNGSNVAGVLEYPTALTTEQGQRLAESWRQSYSGVGNAGKVAILEGGMKFSKIGLTSDEAEMLGSRKFQIAELSRAFRIPPHKLFDLENAHYDNLEAQEIAYTNDTLRPFAARLEAECRAKLLMLSERSLGIRVKFNFDSIVKDDTKTRYGNHAIGIQNGWLSINDVRRSEGLQDIGAEGNIYRVSLATAPATSTNEPSDKPKDTGNPEKNTNED